MMGLEKLLRGLYGSVPQLDMDAQFARVRVPTPMTFDFRALADGIRRNNVGTAGIEVQAVIDVQGGKVVFQPTGQTFPLEGAPPAEAGPARRKVRVRHWEDPAATTLEVVR